MGAEMRVRSRPQTDLFRTFINLPKSGCWLTVFLSIPTWQAEIATRCTLTVGKALILSKSSCRKHNTPANRTENGNSVCAPELKHIPFLIIRRAQWSWIVSITLGGKPVILKLKPLTGDAQRATLSGAGWKISPRACERRYLCNGRGQVWSCTGLWSDYLRQPQFPGPVWDHQYSWVTIFSQ